jgi:RimJ/RimL family protein N-acetyltransferase
MTAPILTERLLLRPLILQDAEPVAHMMTPNIARWTGSWKGENTPYEVAERIVRNLELEAAGLLINRAIVRRADNVLIGWLGGRKLDGEPGRGAIGYFIGEAYFAQGYTKEAARPFLQLMWDALDVDLIEGVVQLANVPSMAVLLGLGMVRVGEREEFASARGAADLCAVFEIRRPQA